MENPALSRLIRENFPGPFGYAPLDSARPLLNCRAQSRITEADRSVIVLFFPYYTGGWENRNISRYAMIPDYHLVAGKYLDALCQQMQALCPENRFQWFTDNSPLREVACANRAGLGVIGKNGLLIHRDYGSYGFLGEIVTDLPLEYSQPAAPSCMDCGLCRCSCPKGALRENGSVDLSLCRSHLTQKKGLLTAEEEADIRAGGLIWGCDVCNDVCPMNRQPLLTPIPEFLESVTPTMSREQVVSLLKTRPYNYRGEKTILRNYDLLYHQKGTL